MYTSTHFYFNVIDFPTTVHLMSNSSDWYAVSSAAGLLLFATLSPIA